MRNAAIFLMLVFFPVVLWSQKVKVIDLDGRPVALVKITDGSHNVFTDSSGVADVSIFRGKQIIVSKKGFYAETFDYDDLARMNFVIRLMPNVFEIEDVVVSANRWEQPISEVPGTVIPVRLSGLQTFTPQTTADLLGTSDRVYIQKSQLGGGSPMLRGLAANRVLIVVDGVRMNNAIYRSGNLQNVISIDPYTLDESEVILGPASNIYGSDALGGVIDFHTKVPYLATGNKHIFRLNVAANYWAADNATNFHADLRWGSRKIGILTSFSYWNFNDLRMGTRGPEEFLRNIYAVRMNGVDTVVANPNPLVQVPSGYGQMYFLQKIKFKISDYCLLTYSFHNSVTTDIPRYDRLIQPADDKPLKYAEWYYGPQHWIMHHLQLLNNRENILYDNMRLTAAFQDYTESRHDRKFGKTDKRHRIENVKVVSLNLDLRKKVNNTDIFYGFEALKNFVFSRAYLEDILTGLTGPYATRYPDGSTYDAYSVYFQTKNYFGQKLIADIGLRYSYVTLYAPFDTTFYPFPFTEASLANGALSGSAGLVYKIAEGLNYKINFSTGFRAPNIDDIGKVFDSEPGKVVVPNPDLKPEYIYTGETGIYFFTGKVLLDLTGFYSYLDNAMVRMPFTFNGQDSIYYDGELSQVQALVNADFARIWGVEATFGFQLLPYLSVKNTVVWNKGYDSNGDPVRHVPPAFGAHYLIFTRDDYKAEVFVRWNATLPYEDLAPTEQAKPHLYAVDENGNPYYQGWWTLNVSFKARISDFDVYAVLENLLDVRYRPYSSGISGPGRSINLGIAYRLGS